MTENTQYQYSWIDKNLTLEKEEWLLKCRSGPLISFHDFLKKAYEEVKEYGNVNLLWKRLPEKYQNKTKDYDLNSMFEFLGKLIAKQLKSLDEDPSDSNLNWIQEHIFNFLYEIIEYGIIPYDSNKVMNYEEILKKYMIFVSHCEGTTFLDGYEFDKTKIFTKDEKSCLKFIRDSKLKKKN